MTSRAAGLVLTLTIAVLLSLATGCSTVALDEALPASPDLCKKLGLDGTWANDELGAMTLACDGKGVLHAAGLEWEDGAFEVNEIELVLTDGERVDYFSGRGFEDPPPGGEDEVEPFLLLAFAVDDGERLFIWAPNVERFESAVAAGRLVGTVESGEYSTSVRLTGPSKPVLAFLEASDNAPLFEMHKPQVFRKLAR